MAGLVLVTHGNFGHDLVEAAQLILGQQDQVESIGIGPEVGVDEAVDSIRKAVDQCDAGKGVVILTDLFGGTPTTLSLSLLKSRNLEVIAGVNLPMVIKVLQNRNAPIAHLAIEAKRAGQQGIVVASEVLKSKRKED